MRTQEFLGLVQVDELRWEFEVTPQLCSFQGNLFGGAALAAAIEALEAATKRPMLWAAAQYLSFGKLGQVLALDLTMAAVGHNTTQARASVSVSGTEVIAVSAALGRRDTPGEGAFAEMPTVARPESCPDRILRLPADGTINDHMDMRVAEGRLWDDLDGTPSATGRSSLWARLPRLDDISAGTLAVLGDFVPYGLGQALGARAGGSSLDNTIRIVKLVPTSWVLLDIRIHAIHGGFGHGLIHLWAEDGTLLATASQTAVLRYR